VLPVHSEYFDYQPQLPRFQQRGIFAASAALLPCLSQRQRLELFSFATDCNVNVNTKRLQRRLA